MQPTNNIQPICLATGGDNYKGQEVTVAGWGTLKEGGSQPATLQKVDVHVWANSRCKSSYGSSAPGGITNHMLCASDYQRDSCSVSVHTIYGAKQSQGSYHREKTVLVVWSGFKISHKQVSWNVLFEEMGHFYGFPITRTGLKPLTLCKKYQHFTGNEKNKQMIQDFYEKN